MSDIDGGTREGRVSRDAERFRYLPLFLSFPSVWLSRAKAIQTTALRPLIERLHLSQTHLKLCNLYICCCSALNNVEAETRERSADAEVSFRFVASALTGWTSVGKVGK